MTLIPDEVSKFIAKRKDDANSCEIKVLDMTLLGDQTKYRRMEILAIDSWHKVIGHISLDIFDEHTSASWVWVDPDWREYGLATRLLNKAWVISVEHHKFQLGIVVNKSPEQKDLMEFYKKRGFKHYSTEPNGNVAMAKEI